MTQKDIVGIKILGKYLLPIYILEKMREKIGESIKENREHAFNLYVNKDNIIYFEDDTEGEEGMVDLKDPDPNKDFIGSFHVHQNNSKGLSPCDMLRLFESKDKKILTFIGTYDIVSHFQLRNKYRHMYGENLEKIMIKLVEMDNMDNKLGSRLKDLVHKKSCAIDKIEDKKIKSDIDITNKDIRKLREEVNKIEKKYFSEHIIGKNRII